MPDSQFDRMEKKIDAMLDCLLGTIEPPTCGLIHRISNLETFVKVVYWVLGIIAVAVISGCIAKWVS